jgi:DNA-directed RNA polymerase subunit RPC12/RpoP
MLLVPIGSAGRLLTFDLTEPHDCATCGESREFHLRLRYEWGSLFYLPVCVTERQYDLACPVCGHGWLVQRRSAEALLGGDPIPWRHRNGWMLLAAVALVAGTALARSRGLL